MTPGPLSIARSMLSAVRGDLLKRRPTASSTPPAIAGKGAFVPTSPTPFMPNGSADSTISTETRRDFGNIQGCGNDVVGKIWVQYSPLIEKDLFHQAVTYPLGDRAVDLLLEAGRIDDPPSFGDGKVAFHVDFSSEFINFNVGKMRCIGKKHVRKTDFKFLAGVDIILSNGHYELVHYDPVGFGKKTPYQIERDLPARGKVPYFSRQEGQPPRFIEHEHECGPVQELLF